MSTIKRSKTDAFSVKESVNIVKLAEAAFEQVSLDQLTDVVVETPTDGDILVYSSDLMAWENVPQGDLNYNLEGLDNVTITSVSDGQVLTWDSGTSKWVNETPTTGATNLDGLSDVTISTPSNGQVLKYNGSAWVNGTDSGATPGGSDTYVQYNDGGVLGGKSSFTFNETTDTLSIPKVKSSDGLYTLSASTLGFGSARIYDSGDEMGFIADATDNLGLDTRAFRFNTASAAPEFYDGSTYRTVYHSGNLTAANTPYDNATSGLTATDVQGAIDEVAASSGGSGYTNYVQPFLRRATHRFFPGKLSDAQIYSRSMAGNRLYLIPFVAPRDMAIVDAAVYFTSSAGVSFQVGIYENQFSAGEDSPGTRIAHASATSVVGSNVVSMSASLSAGGVYWLAFAMASNNYLYALADGDGYAVFGTNVASSWAATDSYAYVASTSTVPSTVSSASMVIIGGSRPAILLGE